MRIGVKKNIKKKICHQKDNSNFYILLWNRKDRCHKIKPNHTGKK